MFNQVAMWTANEILHSATPKKRINKIMYYINVAKVRMKVCAEGMNSNFNFHVGVYQYCLEFCNFNSLRSILGGLQCTPVYRLQRTWAVSCDVVSVA